MEEWRAVVGYEGLYEASSRGSIRSLPRRTPHYLGGTVVRGGKLLKGCLQNGYRQVSLSKQGKTHTYHVHTLVARAFLGVRPVGMLVCHRDGKKPNNNKANLRYAYPQGNSDDMKAHGTVLRGERHGYAKMTDRRVRRLRALAGAETRSA
ncbi:MAG: NUMOD4 domain-containing protein, partial [Deltaproteobacteria bacterium]|nr:NUMOD4 domain-containing protein [Deltaproteobacteria bacterium]